DPLIRYIANEFKRHQATQEINCKAQNEASYLASTYLSYLTSCQKHQSLIDTYGAKGERTTKQAARLVGLDVPDTPSQ
ncbi:hypothetical protein BOX15_Mlig009865g2, partial [Macrostomum lignano]